MIGILSFNQENIDNLIRVAASKYGVPFNLIKAIVRTESNFQPSATRVEANVNDVSYGFMQIRLDTGKWLTGNDKLTGSELIEPAFNLDVGTKYIKQQLDRYKGNIDKAIASYNAGTAYFKDGKFVNQAYVDKVNKWLKEYTQPIASGVALAFAAGLLLLYTAFNK